MDWRRIAWHESGHAVVDMLLGKPVYRVAIGEAAGWRNKGIVENFIDQPEGAFRSVEEARRTLRSPPQDAPARVERLALSLYAGAAAECPSSTGWSTELAFNSSEDRMQLVMVSTAWGVERPFLDWDALEKARALVDEHWGAVADLSDALLRDGEVRSQDVHEILEAAECRSNPFRAMARAVDRRLPRIKEWW